MLSYFLLLVTAGNETTRNATSGGILALTENPDQWKVLKANPAARLRLAVEEIVRWTSPVVQFARTASEDYTLRGQRIKRGDSLVLYYPSANRDEDVFDEPFKFDITRDLNPHVAFGIGEHFCLGANLAPPRARGGIPCIAQTRRVCGTYRPAGTIAFQLCRRYQAHAGTDEVSAACDVVASLPFWVNFFVYGPLLVPELFRAHNTTERRIVVHLPSNRIAPLGSNG
jgi:hypothetical protein